MRAALLPKRVTVSESTFFRRLSKDFGLKARLPASKPCLAPAKKNFETSFHPEVEPLDHSTAGQMHYSLVSLLPCCSLTKKLPLNAVAVNQAIETVLVTKMTVDYNL